MSATADPAQMFGHAEFAAALLEPGQPCPAGLRSWNGSDPGLRLAVNRNNVVGSLIDALAETFPVVCELVGEEFFRAMAGVFVRRSPPRSRILSRYGDEFADFVARFDPAAGLPYLADVARLEFARVAAYHCADVPAVDAQVIARALENSERLAELRLELHPSLAVIDSDFAIVSLWAAHQGALDISTVDPSLSQTAVVVRKDFEVLVLQAPPGVAEFLDALGRAAGLAEAVNSAVQAHSSFDLTAALALLFEHSVVTAIHQPHESEP